MNKNFLAALFFAALILNFNIPVFAKSDVPGLEVSPFYFDLINKIESSSASQILVTNNSDKPMLIKASLRDFKPGQNGKPEFFADPSERSEYTLESWLTKIEPEEFELSPGAEQKVNFILSVPQAVEGVRYGSIVFTFEPSSLSAPGDLSIAQSVGALIFAGRGSVNAKAEISISEIPKFQFSTQQISVSSVVGNKSKFALRPKGEVSVRNMLGRVAGSLYVNKDASMVLPQEKRIFVASFQPGKFAFGRYAFDTVITSGGQSVTSTQYIWIFPLAAIAVAIFLIALLIWWLVKLKCRYDNWLIAKFAKTEKKKLR